MKGFLSVLLLLTTFSCSHFNGDRYIASFDQDLTGNYLGMTRYKIGHKGPNSPAVRLYLNEIDNEPGSYHAILLEYVNLAKMAPKYISSSVTPKLNEVIGYLNSITEKVSVYKIVPTGQQGTFEMLSLEVVGDKIVAGPSLNSNSRLIMPKDNKGEHVLVGATITKGKNGVAAPISFPSASDTESQSLQFSIANLIYTRGKLDSTWRKKYLTGDYLAAYAKKDDKVLGLYKRNNTLYADFFMKTFKDEKAQKRRQAIFTNKKSAYIHGRYEVKQAETGLYVFNGVKKGGNLVNERFVKGRIGVFVDIFDATKALGQDVVELIMVNTKKPKDFLMYYEHPENGEGR